MTALYQRTSNLVHRLECRGEVQTIYAVRNPDKLERLRDAFIDLAG